MTQGYCLWHERSGRTTDMQKVCHLINSTRQQSTFPKVQLLERGGIIMWISKCALLIVWVETTILLLCGSSTGRCNGKLPVHTEPQLPVCRVNLHQFRLIERSAACFVFTVILADTSGAGFATGTLDDLHCVCICVHACVREHACMLTTVQWKLSYRLTHWCICIILPCVMIDKSSWLVQNKQISLLISSFLYVSMVDTDL